MRMEKPKTKQSEYVISEEECFNPFPNFENITIVKPLIG